MDRAPGFQQGTRAVVGGGAHRQLPEIIERLQGRRAVLLSDAALVDSEALASVQDQLDDAPLVACDPGEPTFASVLGASRRVAELEPDVLVAIGGGSTLDTGKLLRGLLAAQVTRPSDIPTDCDLAVLPFVAVPTTAGTGAEMGAAAVAADDTGEKVLIKVSALRADFAVADGWLTTGLPPEPTAFTGADALAQAVLSYAAAGSEAISGQLALRAIDLIVEWLPRVVQDGGDRDARAQMMLGSATSAIAMFNAPITFGLEHAIAEPLGGPLHLPHGHLVAALFVPTAEHNLSALQDRYAEIGRSLGLGATDDAETAAALVDRIAGLLAEVEVPALGDVLDDQPLEPLADHVLAAGTLDSAPTAMSRDDLVAIIEAAWSGSFQRQAGAIST